MAEYSYVTSKELYTKLKRLLELNVKFTNQIRNSYFCIYAKSRILAIKVSRKWLVNIDNWGITSPEVLKELEIDAITPGAYAFKMFKESLREDRLNYSTLWPTLNNNINRVIKSGYNSGLLYARPGFYNHQVWHYDINAAYADGFKNAELPVGIPKIVEGFVAPDDEYLNIYCMDMNVSYDSHKIFPYLVNSGDINKLPSEVIANTGYQSLYKVITQTEYLDVLEDYNVVAHCVYTLRFKKRKGLFDNFVDKYNDLKNAHTGEKRTIYKTILASLAGKLSQSIDKQNIPLRINDFGNIEYETIAIPPDEMQYLNPAVSLFVVDYVRKKVRDIIKANNYKDILVVDTDGFVSSKPMKMPISKNLGDWKCTTYDNIIVNGKRSYFYTKDNEFHSSISGLGDIHDDGLNTYDFNSIKDIYKLKKTIPVTKQVMYCGDPKYVSLNISIGER